MFTIITASTPPPVQPLQVIVSFPPCKQEFILQACIQLVSGALMGDGTRIIKKSIQSFLENL